MTDQREAAVKLDARFPAGPPATVSDVLALATRPPQDGPLTVGDPRVVDFLAEFSRKLLTPSTARRHPELGSLGFFLRRNEIKRAVARIQATPDGALVFPRGLVFHVPPANVDTIFVYSWALSALAGNANIIRVSARAAGAAESILDALNATLAEGAHPAIAQTQHILTYGREDAVTAAFSRACDLRVIWGGDHAVTDIRRHPLQPAARDLTFPDRASFAALSLAAWHGADATARRRAVESFANDAYWFDQAACASPRAVFLVGDAALAEATREEFLHLLAEIVRDRNWEVDAAMAVEKHVSTYGIAAEGGATTIRFVGNSVTSVDLATLESIPRRWLGAGTFPFVLVGSLTDLAQIVQRKDQTLSHFGFSTEDLTALAHAIGGRGIDRMVPFGSALTFSAMWDGYDLLREFTRFVTITI